MHIFTFCSHGHPDADFYLDGSVSAAENFCRNPDNKPDGPYCLTQDPGTRWEYCDVPRCQGIEK